jgi:hypothetical protein
MIDIAGKKPARLPDGTIDLTADGISQEDYLKVVHAIADSVNLIRDKHGWCWVYLKFAAAINPLIIQGERHPDAGNSYLVRVNEPRPEDRYPREWFTDEGWNTYDQVNQDGERMKELRRTYGRILRIVKDRHITLDEAQQVFRSAGLPVYTDGVKRPWHGVAELYQSREVRTEDIAAEKEKVRVAWEQFLAAVGWADTGGFTFSSYDRDRREEIAAKDLEPFIGDPMKNYNPMILPDGRRIHE